MSVILRAAVASDMDAIALIYAHHVNYGTGTFETEPPDRAEITRRWREVAARSLPWLVADDSGAGLAKFAGTADFVSCHPLFIRPEVISPAVTGVPVA